jgi:hypothetical protein
VAIEVELLIHVPPGVASLKGIVEPTQIPGVPDIGETAHPVVTVTE